MRPKTALIHIDMDTPKELLRFWGKRNDHYDKLELERFFDLTMKRALELFRKLRIQVTFFLIGEHLQLSSNLEYWIRLAYREGHEIANHSWSHPYNFSQLTIEQMKREIFECSQIIKSVTGQLPIGFRTPGYEFTENVLQVLLDQSLMYDSSAHWSTLNSLMLHIHRRGSNIENKNGFGSISRGLPRHPYFPDLKNVNLQGNQRKLLEIPLPRTSLLGFPFYFNFHLSIGESARHLGFRFMNQETLVYLFHLIEFCDWNDGLPSELKLHPNLSIPVHDKMLRMEKAIKHLSKNYQLKRSDQFTQSFLKYE